VPERISGRRLNLLARRRSYRLLFLATAGSGVGTYLAALVLTVSVYDSTKSGAWVAALLVADFLPIIVIGLALGPLIDRLSRRRLMITADLVRFGVFIVLPFVDEPWQIVALAGVAGVAAGFFRPAVYAGVPNLVEREDLPEANALLTGIDTVSFMLGPVLAGALLAVTTPNAAYVINALTFLASALLLSGIPARTLNTENPITRGHWRDVKDGFSVVLGTPQLLTVLIVWNVVLAGNAALNVAEVAFAKTSLDSGNFGYGVLVGATGAGLTLGSILTPFALRKIGLRRLYPAGVALMGIGAIAASMAPTVWVAAPLAAVCTLGNGAAIVCNQVLVQRGASDVMRGRVVAVLMSTTYLTMAIAMAGTGFLTNAVGGRVMWTIAGGVYLCAGAVALRRTQALRRALDTAPLAERIKAATQA
jgi:MFS family permease